ncbi:apolipoprotein N-acyltransferase [Mycobacterium sp. IS-1742]|uniref:apolipoprotein N-acyltransferase n=1 Tax=Mycobacterium sp. IS-1742 TaxID=1772285 RepID=UPI0007404E1B|nr:apolipoprotein N-acyltransferase [Mycobacterium sp. IS-1742]KUI24850.1 apolipoprotein N-acyltransferase [Mycobacterium sp. IS-1742]
MRTWPGLAGAFVAGGLPALAFPAPSWWWLAWVGVVPLLLVVRAAATVRAAALRAWCGMAAYVLATQYWLLPSAGPLLLVLALGLGALWVPWGAATYLLFGEQVTAGRTYAALVVLPSAWIVAEMVRSLPGLGGPWAPLGASQWNQPATLASASLGGVGLTGFLIVAANTAIVGTILHRRSAVRIVAAAVAVVCVALGPAWFRLGPAPAVGPTVRVALVQPGDIEDSAARQAAGEALTGQLRGRELDLIVWGESSVGVDLAGRPEDMGRLADLSRRVGADLLVNVDARDRSGAIRKSSMLIGPDGPRGSYSKMRLVPFGEYVPLRPLFGWATRHTKAAAEDRQRGSEPVVLHTGRGLAVGPLISFEATFSDLPRHLVERGAQLLVYQSSTSTYQGSWAQPQLASKVAVHAVEVGHPAVHAGLSGVSSAFDARGRRLAWYPDTMTGVIVVDVPLAAQPTAFQRFGNWVLPTAVSLLAGAALVALMRYRSARHTTRRAG